MSRPMTVDDLILFQTINTAIFLTLKGKGLNDEQIGLALEEDPTTLTLSIMDDIRSKMDVLVARINPMLEPITEEWICEVANRAVEMNLTDGQPNFNSAQGYACAVDAIKLAVAWRGSEVNKKPEVTKQRSRLDEVRDRAKELYSVTEAKYGPEAAARQAFEYIAEQSGVATVADLDLSDDKLAALQNYVLSLLFGTEER